MVTMEGGSMLLTNPAHRRMRAPIAIALVMVIATSLSVAKASRRSPIPYQLRCSVLALDTDGDYMPDCWERKNGLDETKDDAASDLDGDGLMALEEYVLDLRAEGRPLFPYRASSRDSNGNGKPDGDEDLDDDGYSNKWELRHGTDPLDPNDPGTGTPPPPPTPTPTPTQPPAPSPTPTAPPSPTPTPPNPPPSPSPTHPPHNPNHEANAFSIVFEELNTQPVLVYDQLSFSESDGWTFGDREAYRCAWFERYAPDGTLLFKVEIEASVDYPTGFRINDRGGAESGDGNNPPATADRCGSPAGQSAWQPSAGDDHFPHHTHQHLFINGAEDVTAYLDLHRDMCSRAYWTPGDEPGEAILWWDEDFPENMLGHDNPDGMLDCGGGGEEPLAVARMLVIPMNVDTGVCTHDDLDGSRCIGRRA
jgi:hypothetical protein